MPKRPRQFWTIFSVLIGLAGLILSGFVLYRDLMQNDQQMEHKTILNKPILEKDWISSKIRDNLKITYDRLSVKSIKQTKSKVH